MRLMEWCIGDRDACGCFSGERIVAGGCLSSEPSDGMRLSWPPDSLTVLMMEADGVTEAEIGALLLKVARARDRGR
jgi:hypothetical protein